MVRITLYGGVSMFSQQLYERCEFIKNASAFCIHRIHRAHRPYRWRPESHSPHASLAASTCVVRRAVCAEQSIRLMLACQRCEKEAPSTERERCARCERASEPRERTVKLQILREKTLSAKIGLLYLACRNSTVL